MSTIITIEEYFSDMKQIYDVVSKDMECCFDCIVALKRSGLMIGAYMSNKANCPLFVPSEIHSIPKDFISILLVDDKICTGKSMRKVRNKIRKLDKMVISVCMYVERQVYTDYYIRSTGNKIVKMWYEV